MKLRFIALLIIVCLLAAALTGCEPNVPEDNRGENPIDTSETGNNNTPGRTDETSGENPGETPGGIPGETSDETPGGEHLPGENNGENDINTNPAVVGNTPTAGFGLHTRQLTSLPPDSNDFTHLPHSKIGWGLGREVDQYNRPIDAVNANSTFGSLGGMFIGEKEPALYLTFDEGYENGCTPDILDTLKSRGVKATFFVTYDYCKSVPELVQRMIDEGHTVGNHSYSHPSFPECTVEQIREEIGQLHEYVKATFEYEMNLVRFPMGEFSERSLAVAQEMGYTSMFWSFAYMDWNVNNQPEPAQSLEKIKTATHPGGIFLLHAVSQTNAQILGELLDYWHGEGYRLEVIPPAAAPNAPDSSDSGDVV